MTVDIQGFFDNELPKLMAANSSQMKEIGHMFQFSVTGDGGGDWTIDTTSTGPSCKRGVPANPECGITLSDEDFIMLAEDRKKNGMQLFFAGKLKISGNQMLAMKLQKVLDLGIPEDER